MAFPKGCELQRMAWVSLGGGYPTLALLLFIGTPLVLLSYGAPCYTLRHPRAEAVVICAAASQEADWHDAGRLRCTWVGDSTTTADGRTRLCPEVQGVEQTEAALAVVQATLTFAYPVAAAVRPVLVGCALAGVWLDSVVWRLLYVVQAVIGVVCAVLLTTATPTLESGAVGRYGWRVFCSIPPSVWLAVRVEFLFSAAQLCCHSTARMALAACCCFGTIVTLFLSSFYMAFFFEISFDVSFPTAVGMSTFLVVLSLFLGASHYYLSVRFRGTPSHRYSSLTVAGGEVFPALLAMTGIDMLVCFVQAHGIRAGIIPSVAPFSLFPLAFPAVLLTSVTVPKYRVFVPFKREDTEYAATTAAVQRRWEEAVAADDVDDTSGYDSCPVVPDSPPAVLPEVLQDADCAGSFRIALVVPQTRFVAVPPDTVLATLRLRAAVEVGTSDVDLLSNAAVLGTAADSARTLRELGLFDGSTIDVRVPPSAQVRDSLTHDDVRRLVPRWLLDSDLATLPGLRDVPQTRAAPTALLGDSTTLRLRLRLPVVVPVSVTGDTTLGELRMRAMHAAGTSAVTLSLDGGNGTTLRDLQVQEGQRVVVGLPTPAAPHRHRCTAAMWHTVAAALETDPQAAASCGTDEGMALDLSLPGGEVVRVHVPVDATVGTLRLLAAHTLKLRPAEATIRLAVLGDTIADDNDTPLSQVGLEAGSTVAISTRLQVRPLLGSKPHPELVRYLGELPYAPVSELRDILLRADAETVAVLVRALVRRDEGQAVVLLSGVLDRPGVLARLLSEVQYDHKWECLAESRGYQFIARNLDRFVECDAFDDSAFIRAADRDPMIMERQECGGDPVALWQMLSDLGWHSTPRSLKQVREFQPFTPKHLSQMLLADGVPVWKLLISQPESLIVTPIYMSLVALSLLSRLACEFHLLIAVCHTFEESWYARPWAAHKVRCLSQRLGL